MSLTPLTYTTSTPSLRKGVLFLLLANTVQAYLGPGWPIPGWPAQNTECDLGEYVHNDTCEACGNGKSPCPTCEKVCIISDCNSSRSGSTEECPNGFTPTGKWMKSGHKKCWSSKWRYQCCRYRENNSCGLDKGNPVDVVAIEVKKYTVPVGSSCAQKSETAANLVRAGLVGLELAAALAGRRRRRLCFRSLACSYNPYVGVQRHLEVKSYIDADDIYFMLHAHNWKPDSYVRSIGFSYKGPGGVVCKKKFLPNAYSSAYFADEEMECGDDTIRAWGYNTVPSSTKYSGSNNEEINVEWDKKNTSTYYAQDMKLFIGPFNKKLLDERIKEGKGLKFGANFDKTVPNGQLYVYKWKGLTSENQTCSAKKKPKKTRRALLKGPTRKGIFN